MTALQGLVTLKNKRRHFCADRSPKCTFQSKEFYK